MKRCKRLGMEVQCRRFLTVFQSQTNAFLFCFFVPVIVMLHFLPVLFRLLASLSLESLPMLFFSSFLHFLVWTLIHFPVLLILFVMVWCCFFPFPQTSHSSTVAYLSRVDSYEIWGAGGIKDHKIHTLHDVQGF